MGRAHKPPFLAQWDPLLDTFTPPFYTRTCTGCMAENDCFVSSCYTDFILRLLQLCPAHDRDPTL
eukprot:8396404-Prorocentrum_lima.AAC.1